MKLKKLVTLNLIIVFVLGACAAKCSDDQLNGFKTTVDVANLIVQADKPTIVSLCDQGKITVKQRDDYLKIATGLNTFTNVTDGVKHFPPVNATELIDQANLLITEIGPIVVDETTHPILALSLRTIGGGLQLTVKKLGGVPAEIKGPQPQYNDAAQFLAQVEAASFRLRELETE